MYQQLKFLIWAREIAYENHLTLQRLALIYCHDVNKFMIKFNLSLFMPWKHIEALETQRCDNNVVISPNFYAGSVRHLPSHGNYLVLNHLDHMGTDIFMQHVMLSVSLPWQSLLILACSFWSVWQLQSALIMSLMRFKVQKQWSVIVPLVLFGQIDHLGCRV